MLKGGDRMNEHKLQTHQAIYFVRFIASAILLLSVYIACSPYMFLEGVIIVIVLLWQYAYMRSIGKANEKAFLQENEPSDLKPYGHTSLLLIETLAFLYFMLRAGTENATLQDMIYITGFIAIVHTIALSFAYLVTYKVTKPNNQL